jgi:hypothetical protein
MCDEIVIFNRESKTKTKACPSELSQSTLSGNLILVYQATPNATQCVCLKHLPVFHLVLYYTS